MTAPGGGTGGAGSVPVLVVEPGGRGGIAQYARCLAGALAAEGERVVLLTARGAEEFPPAPGVDVRADLPPPPGPGGGPVRRAANLILHARRHAAIRRAAEEIRPAIVHFQSLVFPRRDAALFARLWKADARVVLTIHEISSHEPVAGEERLLARAYGAADGFVVHGKGDAAALGARFSVAGARIAVIPCGHFGFFADVDDGADRRGELGAGSGEPLVLFFGALRPYKGLGILLEAFPEVLRAVPAARLAVVGSEDREAIAGHRARAETLGIGGRARFLAGYRPPSEVGAVFRAADVVVLPYLVTHTSGVVHLAWAFARPVVASAVGDLAEIVEEGKTGRPVAPGDPRALAAALAELLADPVLGRSMGEEGRRRDRERGDWRGIARRTRGFYEAIVRGQF